MEIWERRRLDEEEEEEEDWEEETAGAAGEGELRDCLGEAGMTAALEPYTALRFTDLTGKPRPPRAHTLTPANISRQCWVLPVKGMRSRKLRNRSRRESKDVGFCTPARAPAASFKSCGRQPQGLELVVQPRHKTRRQSHGPWPCQPPTLTLSHAAGFKHRFS